MNRSIWILPGIAENSSQMESTSGYLLAVPTLHCVESLTKEPLTRYKEDTTTESKFHISLQVF